MADRRSNLPAAGRRLEDRQGSVKPLNDKLRKRVDSLRAIQSQRDELEAKLSEEKAALEAKYQKLYEPLYKRRSEIVTGVVEVDGVTKVAKASTEKGVPKFWLNAMKSNSILAEVINQRDELALKYLKDIKWCRIDNPNGFKLEFFFNRNPYFKNTILTKTYHMINEEKAILDKAIGTNIKWFPGNCLMVKKPTTVPKYLNSVIKTETWESFFQFFSPPVAPDNVYGLDMSDVLDLQTKMEHDYEICSIIKHKIIPHAVSWFTGEAAEDDGLGVLGMNDYDYYDLGIKNYLFGKNDDDDKITWKDHKDKALWIKRHRRTYQKYFLESMNECEHHIGYEDYTCKYCALNSVWDEDGDFGMYDEDDEFGMYDEFGTYDEDYGLEDYNNFNLGFKDNLVSKNIDKIIMKDHKPKVNLMKRNGKAYEKYLLKSVNKSAGI